MENTDLIIMKIIMKKMISSIISRITFRIFFRIEDNVGKIHKKIVQTVQIGHNWLTLFPKTYKQTIQKSGKVHQKSKYMHNHMHSHTYSNTHDGNIYGKHIHNSSFFIYSYFMYLKSFGAYANGLGVLACVKPWLQFDEYAHVLH